MDRVARRLGPLAGVSLLTLLVVRVVALPAETVPGWDDVLPALTFALAAAFAAVRAARRPKRDVVDVLLAVGLTAYALNWGMRLGLLPTSPGYPDSQDVLWLMLPGTVLLALVVRSGRARKLRTTLVLDLLIGAAGTGAAVSALLPDHDDVERGALATVTDAAYIVGDAGMGIAAVIVLVTRRWVLPRHLWMLVAAVALLVSADTLYLFLGQHLRPGTPILLAWPVAVWLIALSTGAPGPAGRTAAPVARREVLVAPLVGVVVSVVVLVDGRADLATRWLAAGAILLAVARLGIAFREVEALAGSRELALTDELTGLPNRRAFYRALEEHLGARQPATVVMFDLDGFKEVNDTLGHAAGDDLLVLVARRLAGAARGEQKGREPDVVARLGGDEFAALLPGATVEAGMGAVSRLVRALSAAYEVDDVRVRVSAAAGVVHVPEHGRDVDELLRRADVAMYAAKSGRNGPVVYAPELDTRTRASLARLEEVRSALHAGGLELHYQPKVDPHTGVLRGVEALARLRDRAGSLMPPAEFLGLLAHAGELGTLTEQVLDTAMAQARAWRDAGHAVPVAVNVPPDAVADGDLPALVARTLDRYGLHGSALVVEVTEEVLLRDRARAGAALARLREAGVEVSVDDFGTGYSSLAYLRDLPLDELKLDRSFVAAMGTDPRAERIVASTAALARSLGLRVVAEGVETADERDLVLRSGCDLAQGYLFGRPVPAAQMEEWWAELVPTPPAGPPSPRTRIGTTRPRSYARSSETTTEHAARAAVGETPGPTTSS